MNKKVMAIIIILIAVICAIVGVLYYYESTKPIPMKTVETQSFKFNTTLNDNWTFYKDHEYGYSYHNPDINDSRIMYYNNSMEDQGFFEQIEAIGWKQLHEDNVSSDVYLYESHFDGDTAVADSTHNYYSAFKSLDNGGYVHVSSLDLNRTITIVNAIESIDYEV